MALSVGWDRKEDKHTSENANTW